MFKEIKSYGIKSLVVAVLTAIFSFLLFKTKLSSFYLPIFPYLLLIFFIVYLFTHIVLVKTHEKNKKKFIPAFMLTFALKFFLILSIILIYFFLDKENIINFVLGLFILYIIFTILEVTSYIRYVKRNP